MSSSNATGYTPCPVFLKFESRLSADITNYERAISPNYEIVTDAH